MTPESCLLLFLLALGCLWLVGRWCPHPIPGADLQGAILDGANLRGANLQGAKLNNTSLDGANLLEANLRGATGTPIITTDAIWGNTTCPDGTNSDTNNPPTCDGHFKPIPAPATTQPAASAVVEQPSSNAQDGNDRG